MVGPFMQGVLLMGIIYMYSKGLMSLINDYYRTEINRKLKSELNERKTDTFKEQILDLNDMDQLVNMEINKEKLLNADNGNYLNFEYFSDTTDCYRLSGKQEFQNILFTYIYKMHPLKNPICELNENSSEYFSDIKINITRDIFKNT